MELLLTWNEYFGELVRVDLTTTTTTTAAATTTTIKTITSSRTTPAKTSSSSSRGELNLNIFYKTAVVFSNFAQHCRKNFAVMKI